MESIIPGITLNVILLNIRGVLVIYLKYLKIFLNIFIFNIYKYFKYLKKIKNIFLNTFKYFS